MKFMANVLLYYAESSQKCSAVLLDKICQIIAQTGCFVQNAGINLLVGPDWEDRLESDNQSGISLNLRRTNWSRDTFQPMRRRVCVYQNTNQNITPVIKNFHNSGRSWTDFKMSLQYSSRFHI